MIMENLFQTTPVIKSQSRRRSSFFGLPIQGTAPTEHQEAEEAYYKKLEKEQKYFYFFFLNNFNSTLFTFIFF